MHILVEIGHDDLFDDDVGKMGFISAALETALRDTLVLNGIEDEPEISLLAVVYNAFEGKSNLLKFTVGQGGEMSPIPSNIVFIGGKNEV